MKNKDGVVYPLIHLNGTWRFELLSSHSDVAGDLRVILEKLRDCAPNGRDYYHSGDMSEAVKQHNDRVKRIEDVLAEIDSIIGSIIEQK